MQLSLTITASLGKPPSQNFPSYFNTYGPYINRCSPVFDMSLGLDADEEGTWKEEDLNIKSECYKLMLQAGADCSLETYQGDDVHYSTFIHAIESHCSVRLDLLWWCLGSYANIS